MLPDVICYWKMKSFMILDGVTAFEFKKTLQIHVNVCDIVQVLARVLQCNGGKMEEAEDFKRVFVDYFVLESK